MSDIMWEYEISKKDEISNSYMFHRTKKDKIRQILSGGLDPSNGSKAEKKDEMFLKAVADKENAHLPVDRTISSFFHPHYDQVQGTFGGRLGTGLVVVDSTKVSGSMYVADMDLYDSVISYAPRSQSDIDRKIFDDEQTATALAYLETIKRISRVDNSTGRSYVQPEIMAEGGVSSSAIVGVILDDL